MEHSLMSAVDIQVKVSKVKHTDCEHVTWFVVGVHAGLALFATDQG